MKLSDIYSSREIKKAAGWKQAKKFFMNPETKERFDILNNPAVPPTTTEIINFQKQCINQLREDGRSRLLAKKFQMDLNGTGYASELLNFDSFITNFEESLKYEDVVAGTGGIGGLKQKKNKKQITSTQLINYLSKYKALVNDLLNNYNLLKTINGIGFNSSKKVEAAFNAFEKALEHLQADIKASLNNLNQSPITFSNRGYMDSLIWAGNIIKGEYLEIRLTEFFQKHLIHKLNVEVIQMGQVNSIPITILGTPAMGKGYNSKNLNQVIDIALFDKTSIVQISYELNGKKQGPMSIMEFLNRFKNYSAKDSIYFDNTEYETLKKALYSAVSVKSGNNNIRFKNNVKPSEVIANSNGLIATSLKRLMLLVDKSGPYHSKRILSTSPHYNAMYNYLLGKSLQQIIGQDIGLIGSRKGIETIKQFLTREIGNKYMQIYSKGQNVNIRTDRGLTVGWRD